MTFLYWLYLLQPNQIRNSYTHQYWLCESPRASLCQLIDRCAQWLFRRVCFPVVLRRREESPVPRTHTGGTPTLHSGQKHVWAELRAILTLEVTYQKAQGSSRNATVRFRNEVWLTENPEQESQWA